ncbi:unnamed protein product [Cochlearia groenlandica]
MFRHGCRSSASSSDRKKEQLKPCRCLRLWVKFCSKRLKIKQCLKKSPDRYRCSSAKASLCLGDVSEVAMGAWLLSPAVELPSSQGMTQQVLKSNKPNQFFKQASLR